MITLIMKVMKVMKIAGRVNVLVFRFSGRSYLSVSFCILTTAEEPLEFEMHLE